jgi:hypothetical protein
MRSFTVLVAGALIACAPTMLPIPSPTPPVRAGAEDACARAGYDGTVVGAFSVRAGDLAAQEETPRGPSGPRPIRSRFRDYAPDAPIVLCYFDGFIGAPGGGVPVPPATFRPYDRYVVTIDPSGTASLVLAGHRDTITVAPRWP